MQKTLLKQAWRETSTTEEWHADRDIQTEGKKDQTATKRQKNVVKGESYFEREKESSKEGVKSTRMETDKETNREENGLRDY